MHISSLLFRFAGGLLAVGLLRSPCWSQAEKKPDAADLPEQVSYHKHVRPLFQQHCQGCHQPAKASGGYVMTAHADLLKKSDSGELGIVPKQPDKSLLLEVIGGKDPSMPKDRPPLSAREVALIRRWIEQGAADDTPPSTAPRIDMQHPPEYVLPPVLTSLDFSPDGSLLAVSGYHEALLYSGDGSQLVARLVGMSERIESALFSPDGKRLAVVGGSPGRFGEVQIWDVAKRELALSANFTYDTLFGASWSPDGTKIGFGCTDRTVRAMDAATGKQVLFQGAHDDIVLDTVFSTKGDYLISVSRDRSMKLTEVATQRFVDNITSITPGALKGGLKSVARHPTADELLCGGADGEPKLYKMIRTQARQIGDDFNRLRSYPALPGRLFAVEFSRDGALVAFAASHEGKGEVRICQHADAKPIATCQGQAGPVYALAFHPQAKVLASGGFDGAVRLNDTASGALMKEFVAVPLAGKPVAAGTSK